MRKIAYSAARFQDLASAKRLDPLKHPPVEITGPGQHTQCICNGISRIHHQLIHAMVYKKFLLSGPQDNEKTVLPPGDSTIRARHTWTTKQVGSAQTQQACPAEAR